MLGGESVLWLDASAYFRVFCLTMPFMELNWLASAFLQRSGNMVVPSILNLLSIWGVRLGLSFILVGSLGIHGVWVAMAVELSVRGLLLLYRLQHSKYLKQPFKQKT